MYPPQTPRRRSRRARYAALALWLALVSIGSVLPGPGRGSPARDPFDVTGLDKWLHALAGAGLAGALASVRRPRTLRGMGGVLGTTGAYSAALELLQRRLPWRTAEAGDVGAALLGGCVGVGTWWVASRRARRARARR